jgi:8-hydroxy-5-deazaflavin:NADPH oxidoreductase
MSTITILGSGRVGSNLAAHLARAGHNITIGTRNPTDPRPTWATPDMTITDHVAAIGASEIVINATPGESTVERLSGLTEELAGRILIDVANAVSHDSAGGVTLVYPNSSLAEQLQQALPGTRVVKTLNTMLFSVMTDPHVTKTAPVAFLSGNDDDAKAVSIALLGDLGWPTEWIENLGDITTARGPEAFMLLVPSIARNRGMVPFAMSLAI